MIAEKNLKIYSALYFLYESESDVFYVGFEIIDMAFPYFILAIMVLCVYLHYVWIIYFTFNPGIGGKISMDSFQTNFIFSWLTSNISEGGEGEEDKVPKQNTIKTCLLNQFSFICIFYENKNISDTSSHNSPIHSLNWCEDRRKVTLLQLKY